MNGYYKTELVRGPARQRPWKTVEDLELATLGWVHWHNDKLAEALHELAKADGDKFPYFGSHLWEGYEALDRMEGHLTPWTEGLFTATQSKKTAPQDNSADGDESADEAESVAVPSEEA